MVTVRWRRHPTPVFNFRIYSCALHIYSSVIRTHVGTDSKTVKYRLRSLRTPQNFFDRVKNCIERVKLSSGFAVMVFVFAGSVFTARYLRLNKGTCRPSYLPCPLFIQVLHVPQKSMPKTTRNQTRLNKSSQ